MRGRCSAHTAKEVIPPSPGVAPGQETHRPELSLGAGLAGAWEARTAGGADPPPLPVVEPRRGDSQAGAESRPHPKVIVLVCCDPGAGSNRPEQSAAEDRTGTGPVGEIPSPPRLGSGDRGGGDRAGQSQSRGGGAFTSGRGDGSRPELSRLSQEPGVPPLSGRPGGGRPRPECGRGKAERRPGHMECG